MNSYSQGHEDEILWWTFEGQKTGFFVDVGAHDGIQFSNTYLFELAGWSGICIEAHPKYAAQCQENRPGSTCIHGACIGDATVDRISFYAEAGGLHSSLTGNDKAAKLHCWAEGLTFGGFRTIEVPALTLDSALADVRQAIDLVSIDVEGSEMDVLAGFDLKKHRPRILLVEANDGRASKRLDHYLSDRGYRKIGRSGVNYYYCAYRHDAQRLLSSISRSQRDRAKRGVSR